VGLTLSHERLFHLKVQIELNELGAQAKNKDHVVVASNLGWLAWTFESFHKTLGCS
jgi:hypothetical protein